MSSFHIFFWNYPPQSVELLERALNACGRSLGKEDPRTLDIAFETAKMQLITGAQLLLFVECLYSSDFWCFLLYFT